MSSIQFGGLISGLKTADIIDALVSVENQPLVRLQQKEASLTSQKAAYAQLGSALADLQTKIKAFTESSAGASRAGSSSDTSVFTATAKTSAAVGQYQIAVDRLATSTKATSTGALGRALVPAVDTSLTLDKLNLGTPIAAGSVNVTIDGATVSVAVGTPTSTTLQSVIDGLASAIQTQIGTTGDSATVVGSIVGNHLQLAITGGSGAPHTISFADAVDGQGNGGNAAAALGLTSAGVTSASNATITGTNYLDPVLSSLNTAGWITGGQVSAVVDNVIVHYTVGDPTKTTMSQLLDGLASAVQTQLRTGGPTKAADGTATVTGSVVGNHAQLALSTASGTHTIWFGSASDTSNALGILGFNSASATDATNPTLTGANPLGVVRTTGALDQAGLTGLASTTTGKLTINGVDIAYDTTADSLTTVITRINNSTAGVIASIDRSNDTLILTRKDTGPLAIDIADTGTLATALKLAPGTTTAQTIGKTSQIEVDGRTVVSSSNSVTNAIDGVTINLLSQSPVGSTDTLTVSVDKNAVTSAINGFITSFNSLGDVLDKLTQNTPGTAGGTAGSAGPLASDPTAQTMFLNLRTLIMQSSSGLTGVLSSLGSLGVSTGAVGAAVGTTDRLQLDTAKLNAALDSDPSRVAALLDDTTNGLMKPLLDRLATYKSDADPKSYVRAHSDGIDADLKSIRSQESDVQARVDAYKASLEAKYAALEATLSQLQSQSSQLSSQIAGFGSGSN